MVGEGESCTESRCGWECCWLEKGVVDAIQAPSRLQTKATRVSHDNQTRHVRRRLAVETQIAPCPSPRLGGLLVRRHGPSPLGTTWARAAGMNGWHGIPGLCPCLHADPTLRTNKWWDKFLALREGVSPICKVEI